MGCLSMAKLDATWQVGLAWGIVITALTIAGVWWGVRMNSTAPIGLGFVGWLLLLAWLEKGVKA